VPGKAHYTFIIAIIARTGSSPTLRELQSGGYTQDTDENREYLQKQIPPMQNGKCPPLPHA
jgi:hypothetical protein